MAATVLSLLGLLWYHIGADETKVWIKFGRVFYREIKFSELTALKLVVNRLKLYAGKTIINIEPGRFNYSVVYYGLLKELQTRRFELPNNTQPNDPNWEEDAQYWRNLLAERIFVNHSEFFRGNPVELAYLNSLICPPGL
ncbi:hypothetical protein [Gleimia coleocanis]|uniref:hypothetical protein n=1 Tax=Gleimia coleocanis TaxID=103618 RepID=UPI0006826815|nr:hypothetical protein [Gleimia coleocanis]